MTADALRERIRKHNALQAALGLMALAGAPLLWWLSFWVIRILSWLATFWFLGRKTADVTFWIAVGGLVLLAIEGLRQGWELLPLQDLADRPRVGLFMPVGPYYYGNLFGYSYLITHALFIAPQVTVAGVRALRLLIRPGPLTIDLAAHVYNDLAKRRAWVDVGEYPGGRPAAALLRQLDLIWLEDEEGAVRLRIPPGEALDAALPGARGDRPTP